MGPCGMHWLNSHKMTLQVWWHVHHKESTSSSYFTPLFACLFLLHRFFDNSLFWTSNIFLLCLLLLNVWTHPHPISECWPASSHSMSAPSSLFFLSILPSLHHFSLLLPFFTFPPFCLSIHPFLSVSLPPTDSSDSDLELSTVRHQPEGLDQLQAQTKFTRKELQSLYRGFKNVRLAAPSAETSLIALLLLLCFI